ncbi:MAG TPA: hypothetical protein VE982_07435 [Gaiellaceae bacterium]|nr:hypothetical protein [Gaiellaceae bacterium]
MTVAQQWEALGSELPERWARAQLRLELPDRQTADRAAAMLGPAGPYRAAPTVLLLNVARDGTAASPDHLTRLLRNVNAGTLSLSGSQAAPQSVPRREITTLTESWDRAIAGLPADWSDLYAEVELTSTDFVERASVLCVQCNPRRDGERAALRFRCARTRGYGVSAEMARRCLERCDAERITGRVVVLRVLSDTHHVATQGPVWLANGKTL